MQLYNKYKKKNLPKPDFDSIKMVFNFRYRVFEIYNYIFHPISHLFFFFFFFFFFIFFFFLPLLPRKLSKPISFYFLSLFFFFFFIFSPLPSEPNPKKKNVINPENTNISYNQKKEINILHNKSKRDKYVI